jgi:hypothetical protein
VTIMSPWSKEKTRGGQGPHIPTFLREQEQSREGFVLMAEESAHLFHLHYNS